MKPNKPLTDDIARCDGVGSVEDGVQYWREGCETCLRRTAPRPVRVTMMMPPPIITFECEYLIEPNTTNQPTTYPTQPEQVNLLERVKECGWEKDDNGNWSATCGEMFILLDGTPAENKLRYCPFCGRKITQAKGCKK
jgi:hypothetical protein